MQFVDACLGPAARATAKVAIDTNWIPSYSVVGEKTYEIKGIYSDRASRRDSHYSDSRGDPLSGLRQGAREGPPDLVRKQYAPDQYRSADVPAGQQREVSVRHPGQRCGLGRPDRSVGQEHRGLHVSG